MKKSSIVIIVILAVVSIALGTLYIMSNEQKIKEINARDLEISNKTNEIVSLTAEVSNQAGQIEILNNNISEKNGQIESLKSDLSDKTVQIGQLSDDVTKKAEQIEALSSEIEEKKKQVEDLTADTSNKAGQIEILNNNISEKNGQIESLKSDLSDKTVQIGQLSDDVTKKAEQIETLSGEIEEKEKQVEVLTAEASSQADQIEVLNKGIAEKNEQVESLKSDLSDKTVQIGQLSDDVTKKAEQIEQLNDDVTKKAEEIERLNEDVTKKAEQIDALGIEIEEKIKQAEAFFAADKEKTEEIEGLREELDLYLTKLQEFEEKTAVVDTPDSFDMKISIDKDTFGMLMGGTAEAREQVGMISNLLDAITIKGVSYKDSAELNLVAGSDSFLTIGAKTAEDGITIASSLLGENVIYMSDEELQMLTEQSTAGAGSGDVDFQELTNAIQGLDQKQVEKDWNDFEESLKKSIEEKKGETETGEFMVDGFTFTYKTPVDMTFIELMELEINSLKELLGKASLKPVMDILSRDTDISSSLDKALEELKNQPANQKYNMELAIYENEKGSKYYAVILGYEGTTEKICFGFGTVDGLDRVIIHADAEQMVMDIAFSGIKGGAFDVRAYMLSGRDRIDITGNGDSNGNIDILCDIQSAGVPVKIHVMTADGEENRKNYSMEFFFLGNEKPLLSISGTSGKGGEITSAFEGENIEVIPFSKLLEGDQATMTTLSMTAVTNLMKGVNTLTKNLPPETATWVSSLFSGLMGGAFR